ncbi:LLM class flavin-dependent oxidoreductase [Nakamurella deserti]|uniref:LLM class flavin-dependent oxidoreductase n=1 Tax=Nakamurella deserti TaxID=2164074 RepID=UPI000DBE3B39|nr:LLM class flavin-dependent oxidoreductase [Nakamurella deserti]
MRIGTWLTGDRADDPAWVTAAERSGAFGVLADPAGPDGARIARAAEIAARTVDPRVVVRVVLGVEHPVTLAEEVAVLDHLSAGRVVCVVDTGALDASAALEDLTLLRLSWSARFFRHDGARWTVPSGLLGDGLPTTVSVTPKPAQLDIPVWLDGAVAAPLAVSTGLPAVAHVLGDVDPAAQVQPAAATLSGDLEADRRLVGAWAAAAATHLLVAPAAAAAPDSLPDVVARYLQPEVGMPSFPRIMAESAPPHTWTPPV